METKLVGLSAIVVIILVAVAAYFTGAFGMLAFATVDGKSVVVPRLGSVICEDTGLWKTAAHQLVTRRTISASVPQSQSCPGMSITEASILRNECYLDCGFDPFLICTAECNQGYEELIRPRTLSTLSWRDGFHPGAMSASFVCNTTRCKISEPSFGWLSTFWSQRATQVVVNSIPTAGERLVWDGDAFCSNDFPFTTTSISSFPRDVDQGDQVSILASAYRDSVVPDFYGDNLTATTAAVDIQEVISRLAVYADGTKFFKANTDGCMREDVIGLINYGDYPLYQSKFNLYTDESGQLKTGLLEVTLPTRESLPTHLDVGDGWTFVFEWKPLSTAFGNIREYQGESVWVDAISNNVYSLEEVQTAGGQSYMVPTQKILSNIECFENMECQSKYGTGYFCNENFQCDTLPNFCVSDLDCATYGAGQCSVIGGRYYELSGGGCVNSQCVEPTKTEVSCCPGTCGPAQTCNPAVGCISTGCEIQACPGECCVESECYVKRDCQFGSHCVVTGDNVAGFCSQDFFCGDGKCTPEIGEDFENCRADCHFCGNDVCESYDILLCPDCDETLENCSQDCGIIPETDDLLGNSFFWGFLGAIGVIAAIIVKIKFF